MSMRSLLDFLKYHNAVPVVIAVLVLGTGAAVAASPKLRQSVFSSGGVVLPAATPQPTDTRQLTATDLDTFDLDVRIDALTENETAYFIAYSYSTLEVVPARNDSQAKRSDSGGEGMWRLVRKTGKMEIPKALLGSRDFKTYLVEQIGQVIDRELAYLKESKLAVLSKAGAKDTAQHASLVGTKIDADLRREAKEKELKSAQKKTDESAQREGSEESDQPVVQPTATPGIALTEAQIRELIVQAVADFLAVDTSMPESLETSPSPVTIPEPAPQSLIPETIEEALVSEQSNGETPDSGASE